MKSPIRLFNKKQTTYSLRIAQTQDCWKANLFLTFKR
jgi:hypothetical protein